MAGAHTLAADPVEKPYPKSRILASGSYSKPQGGSVSRRRSVICSLAVVVVLTFLPIGALGGPASIKSDDLKEWLSFIASDDTQGRAIFSAGLGLAAAYISDHLRVWGVKPGGDHSSYLQTVRVLGVKSTSHSTITVRVGSESRTFADNDALVFPRNAGGKQRLTIDRVEFAGYGLDLPAARHTDFANKDMTGAAVIWLGAPGPREVDAQKYRLLLQQRGRAAVEQAHAASRVGPDSPAAGRLGGGAPVAAGPGTNGGGRRGGTPDCTTVERWTSWCRRRSGPKTPSSSSLSRAPVKYDELKRKAQARDPLPTFQLEAVTLTFNVDMDYEIVRTQLTQNVVGIVEGSDPLLKNTYVAFGAHYDHVGYADAELTTGDSAPRRVRAPGRVTPGAADDRIWNGADDDGSGTVGLMALARAFVEGPRPKRSLLFVWHTGEETGRYGSLYFADYPTVPLTARRAVEHRYDRSHRQRHQGGQHGGLVGSDHQSELHAISAPPCGARDR